MIAERIDSAPVALVYLEKAGDRGKNELDLQPMGTIRASLVKNHIIHVSSCRRMSPSRILISLPSCFPPTLLFSLRHIHILVHNFII